MSNLSESRDILTKAIQFQKDTMDRLMKDFRFHNHEANRIQFTIEKMRGECDKNMERLKEVEREIEQVPTLQRQLV
jgi:DNA integrity scanning protein DisA with diadenylate cyclase activity